MLDGYNLRIEDKMHDQHHNTDSLSEKVEFYERLEQKQANQTETQEGFSFLDKESYKPLPLMRWLDQSGNAIPEQPKLPVEEAAEFMILSKKYS